MKERPIAPRSPWQNPYIERVNGSIRRECLDHAVVLNERHLKRLLRGYFAYYRRWRPDPPAAKVGTSKRFEFPTYFSKICRVTGERERTGMDIRRRIAPQTPSNPVEASGFVVGIRWTGRLGSIIPGRAALFRPAGSLQSVKKLTECSLWPGVCLTETAKTEGRATDLAPPRARR